jgi:hypothetical protein
LGGDFKKAYHWPNIFYWNSCFWAFVNFVPIYRPVKWWWN